MARPSKLADAEIKERLKDLPGWDLKDNKLHRRFKFKSFVEAFGVISRIALHAERLNHHPEIFNVYSNVEIHLNTHDAGGITELDFELARAINSVAG